MSHHSVNYDPNKERVDLLTKQQLQHQEATSTQQTNAPSPKPPTSSQTQISVGPLVQAPPVHWIQSPLTDTLNKLEKGIKNVEKGIKNVEKKMIWQNYIGIFVGLTTLMLFVIVLLNFWKSKSVPPNVGQLIINNVYPQPQYGPSLAASNYVNNMNPMMSTTMN